MQKLMLFLLLGTVLSGAHAADYYVDNVRGDDQFTGLAKAPADENAGPFATINRAIKLARAGDSIHLNPTEKPYRQMADFYDHPGGEVGKPITLDGHGATLSGADPCLPDGWKKQGELLRRDDQIAQLFLVIDGKMVFATRNYDVLKAGEMAWSPEYFNRLLFVPPEGNWKQSVIEVGQPDGEVVTLDATKWQQSGFPKTLRYNGLKAPTWVKIDGKEISLVNARDRLEAGQWTNEEKAMFFRLPDGKKIEDLKIESVQRGNGVQMNGKQSHFVVKNLNVRHVYNDGFNIHGEVKDATFLNCNAFQCGDEGFSAHDKCETTLDGAVYEQCDNGIANVNVEGFSITRNLVVRDSRNVGYLLESKGTATHTLENAIFADNPAQISGGNFVADNVLIVGTKKDLVTSALSCDAKVELKRLTVIGNDALIRISAGAQVSIENSLFAAGQKGFHVRAAEPLEMLKLKDSVFGEGLTMEWGAKYPWTTLPLEKWLETATQKGIAQNATVEALSLGDKLANGKMPEALPAELGCSRELWEKFVG